LRLVLGHVIQTPHRGLGRQYLPVDYDALDLLARLLLGKTQFVELLQVEPHFGGCAELLAQAQRRVGGQRPLTLENPIDPIGRNVQRGRELRATHVDRFQFVRQELSRMDRGACHGRYPHVFRWTWELIMPFLDCICTNSV